MKNLYTVLGVPPSASYEEIHAAYRALATALHPDMGGDGEQFAEVAYAGRILRDPDERAAHDAKLNILLRKCSACHGLGLQFVTVSFTQARRERCGACNGEGYHERD